MTMLRAALILGLLSAVGPFAIDMYLPAMPSIAIALDADISSVQFTLTAYFLSFGAAQLFYGPWSDQMGRKVPLYVGIGVFIVASIGCAMAPTIGWLVAFRALQGAGGAALMVLPRAVIRDMHTGTEATKLLAMVILVISVSPMLAPLVGSGLIVIGEWRLIFWALCFVAALSLLLTVTALPETLSSRERVPVNLGNFMRGCSTLIKDPIFMGLTLIGGFGFASFMVFIASAAFVYSGQFELSPTGFSLAFAVNAVGFVAGSQVAGPLGEKFGILSVMRWAVIGFSGFSIVLWVVGLCDFGTLPVVIIGLFFANTCLGLVIPTTMVMALDPHGEIAGLASSLSGTLQTVTGGVMVVIAGLFFDGTAVTMIGAIAFCAALALMITLRTLGIMEHSNNLN